MNINSAIVKVNKRIEKTLPENYSMIYGGKRVRASLLLAFGRNEKPETIDIAAAIELMHAATLIHDDIIDNSTLRRGRPPLFREIGVSAGVLHGDYLLTKAFSLISGLMDPVLNKEITLALSEMLEGAMLEKQGSGDMSTAPAGYFTVIQKKTGVLFAVAAKLGALRGRHDKIYVEKAYNFGLKTGTAYQVVDDLLDYFGSSPAKDRFDDIKGGLVTLPMIYLTERCSINEMEHIKSVFGEETAAFDDLVKLSEMMEAYNVPEDVAKKVDELLKEAEQCIGKKEYTEVSSTFDVLSWVTKQVQYAQSSDSRRGICRR